jgi:hypothetical protein
MTLELNIVTGFAEFPTEGCLHVIRRVMERFRVPNEGFTLYGESIDLTRASKVLEKTKRSAFLIDGRGWRFHLSSVKHHGIDIFAVKAESKSLVADAWISEMSLDMPITQAWLVNDEYDFWQNAEDPLQYSSRGRQWDHLRTKSNGLPPPLEQIVVDVSGNPGRRVIRAGHVEAVGCPMWLGGQFWVVTGANKSRVLAQRWLDCKECAGGLMRVQTGNEPFSTAEGESAATQVRLRKLLYPESE